MPILFVCYEVFFTCLRHVFEIDRQNHIIPVTFAKFDLRRSLKSTERQQN